MIGLDEYRCGVLSSEEGSRDSRKAVTDIRK